MGKGSAKDGSIAQTDQKIIGQINFQLDIISMILFICGLFTRMYNLEKPRYIV